MYMYNNIYIYIRLYLYMYDIVMMLYYNQLVISKCGENPSTIRTTALALRYTMAKYTAPVWARSSHAKNLDPELNQSQDV